LVHLRAEKAGMAENLIDLKTLLVERPDCDAGTVQQLRNALGQGGSQHRTLRDVTEVLKKKLEAAQPAAHKVWHLKIGIASFFLGFNNQAVEHLNKAETAVGAFYLGRALLSRNEPDEALKAFEKAEKTGWNASQVRLQRAGILRMKGDVAEARKLLETLKDLSSHSAEYHFQLGMCHMAEGERGAGISSFERAITLDPAHTNALFQLAHANDLAGNDEDAITCYERCLKHPPVHLGTLMNLGILYEDYERYDKAADCYKRILSFAPIDERAKLFSKDANASLTMRISPDEETERTSRSQLLDTPVTDFELSVRARNCLKKMNIRTLGDLTRISEQTLLASKNFGETSLLEIKEMMASKALKLGQSIQETGPAEVRYRPAAPVSEEQAAILSKPVSDLNLSVRARKCMNRLGINTLGDLVERKADELLEAKNFGQTSLVEVKEKLAGYGLSLREE
jgi:DNA-directed RNA polymerase subunit alpha